MRRSTSAASFVWTERSRPFAGSILITHSLAPALHCTALPAAYISLLVISPLDILLYSPFITTPIFLFYSFRPDSFIYLLFVSWIISRCCEFRSKKETQAVPKSISLSLCDVEVSRCTPIATIK
jgi:hypothetical protein